MAEVFLAVRIPEDLKRRLKIQAAAEGTTVQALVAEALEKLLKEREEKK